MKPKPEMTVARLSILSNLKHGRELTYEPRRVFTRDNYRWLDSGRRCPYPVIRPLHEAGLIDVDATTHLCLLTALGKQALSEAQEKL